jgi:nickel transport protein
VVVEGYFSASVKAKDCPVEVFDERAKKIHEGKTDQKGTYSFKTTDLPAFTGGLRIVLEGGMGHKAKYTLKASDIPGSVAKAPLPKDQPRTNQSEVTPETAVVGSTQIVDQAALMTAVEAAVDKKLDPLVKMLGKQEKLLLEQKYGGPRLSDVVGGIGWIVGLVGLAAFFWGRNRPPRN